MCYSRYLCPGYVLVMKYENSLFEPRFKPETRFSWKILKILKNYIFHRSFVFYRESFCTWREFEMLSLKKILFLLYMFSFGCKLCSCVFILWDAATSAVHLEKYSCSCSSFWRYCGFCNGMSCKTWSYTFLDSNTEIWSDSLTSIDIFWHLLTFIDISWFQHWNIK